MRCVLRKYSKFYANRCIAGLIATLSGQYYGFAIQPNPF